MFFFLIYIFFSIFFFFFKQKTAYEITRCWSSDVCSSDLPVCGSPMSQRSQHRQTETELRKRFPPARDEIPVLRQHFDGREQREHFPGRCSVLLHRQDRKSVV